MHLACAFRLDSGIQTEDDARYFTPVGTFLICVKYP